MSGMGHSIAHRMWNSNLHIYGDNVVLAERWEVYTNISHDIAIIYGHFMSTPLYYIIPYHEIVIASLT